MHGRFSVSAPAQASHVRMPRVRRTIAVLLTAAMMLQPTLAVAQAPVGTQDIGWPRQFTKDGATLVIYQPQLDDWKNYKELNARAAFALTPSGGQEALGVVNLEADTMVDKDTRTVYLRDIDVKDVRFPGTDPNSAEQLANLFKSLMPKGGSPIALDRLMAEIEKDKVPAPSTPLKNDPPTIFYSAGPAILLIVEQTGGVGCHTGRQRCFFQRLEHGTWRVVEPVLKDPKAIYGEE